MRLPFLWFKARHRQSAQRPGEAPSGQRHRRLRALILAVAAGTLAGVLDLPPAQADAVAVEAVPQDSGARLVMTWPNPVGFEATAAGGRLQLRFERPIDADFGPVRRLSRWIGVATLAGDGRSVTFPLAAGVSVIGHTDGNKVIVDLFEKQAQPRAAAEPAPAPDHPASAAAAPAGSQAPAVRVRAADHAGYSRVVFDWPNEVGYRIEQHEGGAALVFDRVARIDPSALNKRPLKLVQGLGVNVEGGQTSARLQLAPGAEVAVSRAGTKVVVDVRPAPKPATPQAAAAPVDASPPAPTVTKPATAASKPAGKHSPELRFAWEQGAAAALVRRGQTAWLVFDQPMPTDLDPNHLSADVGNAVTGIDRVDHAAATVLRLRLRSDRVPLLRSDQGAWILDFAPVAPAPAQPIPVAVAHDEKHRARLTFEASEAAAPLAVTDEETGRTLIVVPVRTPGAGVAEEKVLPELRVLATSQGIAIEPGTDSLRVLQSEHGIELTSPNGLQLSAQPPAAEVAATAGGDKRPYWLEPRTPVDEPTQSTRERRRQLERATAEAAGPAREQARLDLAAFFLSEGLAAEAYGTLALVVEARPAATSDADIRLMQGAAAVLLGRTDEAEADLAGTAVAATEDGRLWRTIADASAGRLESADAVERVEPALSLIEAYPKPLRFAAARPLAEAALDQGRLEAAEKLIGMLGEAASTVHEQAWIPYLKGQLAARQGRPADALRLLALAANSPSRGAAMRAQHALTRLRFERGDIDATAAAKELQAVRANWRGDRFELQILRELAQLQFAAGAYAAGLRTLKEAALYLADLPEANGINREISEAFQGLFLSERAASVPPLMAVALFSDFRELVPSGPAGHQLAERLADRLTELDLLPEAVSVLEIQLNEAPEGVERARLGLKLATTQEMNGNAAAALATLQRSASAALPAGLMRQRKRVEAEALIALGRDGDALALLGNDPDAEADRMRADILRRKADWSGTAASLERLVAPPAVTADSGADRSAMLLELAATMALSDDREAMAGLREEHGQVLAATPAAGAFALITGENAPPAMDAAALDAYVQEALAIRPLLSAKP
ncbi:MAG: hypothetical protein P9C36_11515 [Defluviicoccus sp.]|nr:hypothetical protein [Defluviicoccus sp.]MDG4593240.1 hypothetical protein [Defluviicoccus sp.]MDS4010505.1 hypothetical protein [Defluviicoccus sp.]